MKKTSKNIKNLKYLCRHKVEIFRAAKITGLSFWQCLCHDNSKFLPYEWRRFSNIFYKHDGDFKGLGLETERELREVRAKHQKRNKHHWQYWTLLVVGKRGELRVETLKIPFKFLLEMVTDWMAVEMVLGGRYRVGDWWEENKNNIIMDKKSQETLEELIIVAEMKQKQKQNK